MHFIASSSDNFDFNLVDVSIRSRAGVFEVLDMGDTRRFSLGVLPLDGGRLIYLGTWLENGLAWGAGSVLPVEMKSVDMDMVSLVHSGEAWRHQQPPCSRQMIQHLEKNEGVVTWVQVCFFRVRLCVIVSSNETAQRGDRARPVPCHTDRRQVLHDEPAHDEGRLVGLFFCLGFSSGLV